MRAGCTHTCPGPVGTLSLEGVPLLKGGWERGLKTAQDQSSGPVSGSIGRGVEAPNKGGHTQGA